MKESKNPKQQNNRLAAVRKKILLQVGIAASTLALVLVLVFTMSAAWYTNVVKSGDLIFQTAVWGFEGRVDIGAGAIEAAPGKSGVVSLEMDNTGQDMIFAGVHVAKTMDTELGKRIYLYVDVASTKNGETIQRVYLNSKESYTYLIPSQSKLVLQEQYYNDARIMWTWVYDVVGYYFLGTVNQLGLSEEEYLRPVEYNLDRATFDENGNLLTVDGSTTVAEFLTELSAADGYAGTIDPSAGQNGYYPVEVDGSGKGVWLYLCNWAEIQQEAETDVALGSATEKKQGVVRLNISAQGGQFETVEVSTVAQLQDALNSGTGAIIQLSGDLQLENKTSLKLNTGEDTVLNLNGHTISSSDATPVFEITHGSKLTVFDGTVQGCNASGSTGIKVTNGALTMSKVTVNNLVDALTVADSAGNGQDSMIRLSECDLTGRDCALYVKGNGSNSSQLTQITVEKSNLHGNLGAIYGHGSEGNWGTAIQILDSRITGGYTAIFHPQKNSTLTITNSTLTGETGVAIKGGKIRIVDSIITANGEGLPDNLTPGTLSSGFRNVGAAVYLETNYDWSMSVTIEGDSTVVTSEKDYAVRVNVPNAPNAEVQLMGGTYNTNVADFVPEGYRCDEVNQKWVVTKAQQ